jgi:hypothetical protein
MPDAAGRSDPAAASGAREPSDDGRVSAAIVRTALCVNCIAETTGVPAPRVQTVLATLAQTFALTRATVVRRLP